MDKTPLTADMLPEAYIPDWDRLADTRDEDDFTEAAFYLARECVQLCTVIANMQTGDTVARNDAINVGLAVRLSKLAREIVKDLSDGECFQQLSLSRQILETSATLLYLLHDDGSGIRYDQYVQDSLVAERETLKVVQENIDERGGEVWHIEERMRRSIEKTAAAAGVESVDALPGRKQIGFPSVEERIKLLGVTTYVGYRAGSAEVHGTWTDLIKYHLSHDGTTFTPNSDNPTPRPQVATATTSVMARVFGAYLDDLNNCDATTLFDPLLDDIIARNQRLIELHEEWLERRDS